MARHYRLTPARPPVSGRMLLSGLAGSQVEKKLALYIRYQTTNQRACHRCLGDLLKPRRARQIEQRGYESQQRRKASDAARQLQQKQAAESQELPFQTTEIQEKIATTPEAALVRLFPDTPSREL